MGSMTVVWHLYDWQQLAFAAGAPCVTAAVVAVIWKWKWKSK